jgi:hypothetical protein
MAPMNAITEPATLTAEPLWRRTRAMFERAVAAIGLPAAIAASIVLAPWRRSVIVRWLAPLEHIVRKLLLAEAGELSRSQSTPVASGPRLVEVRLAGMAQHADLACLTADKVRESPSDKERSCAEQDRSPDFWRPETWAARFSFAIPRDPLAMAANGGPRVRSLFGPSSPAPLPPLSRRAEHAGAAFLLARRLEAVRRVLADPLPHARRLAHRLRGLRRRFPEVVTRYIYAPQRANGWDPWDMRLGIDAMAHAGAYENSFDDTS